MTENLLISDRWFTEARVRPIIAVTTVTKSSDQTNDVAGRTLMGSMMPLSRFANEMTLEH